MPNLSRILRLQPLGSNIPDLNLEQASLLVLLDVDVDGEMGVDVAHLVLEALGDTDDQVVDDGSDGAESSDALAAAMVELNVDEVLLGVGEGNREVAEVLAELAWRPSSIFFARIATGRGWCVPRGPSTVTTLVLMETFTAIRDSSLARRHAFRVVARARKRSWVLTTLGDGQRLGAVDVLHFESIGGLYWGSSSSVVVATCPSRSFVEFLVGEADPP